MSSTIVNVTWSDIIPSKTYGIITSYSLKYKRADGRGTEKEEVVFEKSALISGLDEYVEYDIKVAGITSKGAGVYSAVTKQRTLQDGNFVTSFLFTLKVLWHSTGSSERLQ